MAELNPDLRTLAAEAIDAAIDATGREHGDPQPNGEELVDAVLAAVLPEHRRMVLTEAADVAERALKVKSDELADGKRSSIHPTRHIDEGIGAAKAIGPVRQAILAAAAPPASLSAPVPDPNCFFCEPDRIVAARPLAYSRWDSYPAAPGHALITPRRHVASVFDATADELREMIDLLPLVRAAVIENHGEPDGWTVGINDGEAAGRTVPHLHLHLIPRRHGDVPDPRGGVRLAAPRGDFDGWLAETTLSAPVPAGNAPAVPEEADGQRAGQGDALTYAEMEAERDRLAGEVFTLTNSESLDVVAAELERDEARADRDRLARELSEAQTELALVKSRPLFSTRKVMQTLLEALGDPVDEQELILRIDDGLRLADVAQRVIAALALTAAERDVVEAAKAWRGNRYASASILELAAAVDALPDAGTQPCPTPSDAKSGMVPLADVLDALRDEDAVFDFATRFGATAYSHWAGPLTRAQMCDYLAERFAPTTAPEGADERNGHG